VRREDVSPDGRFVTMIGGLDDSGLRGIDIVDVSDGHVVINVEQHRSRFTPDGRFVVVQDAGTNAFVKYDLAAAKRVWSTIPTWHQDGFYMIMADGHVRLSRNRHVDLWLVRGFEVRRFDATAKQFLGLPDR